MTALLLAAIMQQGIPARVVILEAKIDKIIVGEVTYLKQVIPGRGIERTTTFNVKEEEKDPYVIKEKRTFDNDGNPLTIERTYTENGEVLKISVNIHDNIADLTYSVGNDQQTNSIALIAEDASMTAVSETWFSSKIPRKGEKAVFWEFDLDVSNWIEKTVTYHGKTDLKIGDEFINVHRLTVGKNINIYCDDMGMPYKLADNAVKGGMVLMRTFPLDGGGS